MKENVGVFPSYDEFGPLVPVRKVSRDGVPAIHRFYDTSPVSPSGRLLALTEFDFEDRLPAPGDEASVVVIDLATGLEVFRTRTSAWDTQLGAQAQWGASDEQLLFNRMDTTTWRPYGVVVNPTAATERRLRGTIYMVSPDGRSALSPDLVRIWLIQPGYGVIVPAENRHEPVGAPDDDGLFITAIEDGSSRLALSFRQIYDAFPSEFEEIDLSRGGFYGFHAKWSPDGKRIMFLIRWKDRASRKGSSRNWIVTMDADQTNLKIALTPARWAGGHHPNWCPDGEHIVMNLLFPTRKLRFERVWRLTDRVARRLRLPFYRPRYVLRLARFRYDGADLQVVAPSELGSGHPTWHDELEAVLTDAYPWEAVAAGDGTSPIRLISTELGKTQTLVRVRTAPEFTGPRQEWRVDPHPAWTRDAKKFVFNGCPDGVRGVFIADVGDLPRRGLHG